MGMKILTANRLSDGEAVWLAPDRSWVESIDHADVAHDKPGEEKLEAVGRAPGSELKVVDINLVDVTLVDGRLKPTRLREQIRAAGPTNRTDLGKQARPEVSTAA